MAAEGSRVDRWQQNIHAAELRLIAGSPRTLAGAAITAALGVAVLWLYLDHALILAWASAMAGLTALRFALWRRFHTVAGEDAAVIAWDRTLTLTVAASGALWGIFGLSFYLLDDAEIRGVVLLILASMLAAGTIFYSAHLRAHNAYLLCCTLPIAIASFFHDKPASILFGCVALAYIALIVRAAQSFNHSIAGAIRLQLENASLVDGLKAAKDGAEEANRSKSQFLANMSHELRTPLNAVIGYSEMMLEDAEAAGSGQEHIADLRRIHGAGRHLLSLVNDVLDLSKIEAGRMDVSAAPIEIAEFLDEVVATVSTLVQGNGNTLETVCAADIGSLVGDATKLRQIVLNLLGNAAKFTRGGSITLTAERARPPQGDWISISVADTGIGMTEQTLAKLFTAFTQADTATASKYGGTGLGLALSQRLARLMGGTIAAESEFGRGSCFTLRLPATPPAPPEERGPERRGERACPLVSPRSSGSPDQKGTCRRTRLR